MVNENVKHMNQKLNKIDDNFNVSNNKLDSNSRQVKNLNAKVDGNTSRIKKNQENILQYSEKVIHSKSIEQNLEEKITIF